jgi:hypothetical protein
VLLGRDRTAPATVRFWCAQREAEGKTDSLKLAEAQACADAMVAWQERREPARRAADAWPAADLEELLEFAGDVRTHQDVPIYVRRLVGELADRLRSSRMVASSLLDIVEGPLTSRDLGAPGSLARRANDIGRRLRKAENAALAAKT